MAALGSVSVKKLDRLDGIVSVNIESVSPHCGYHMKRFIEDEKRGQGTLLLEHRDDYVAEDNQVRVVDILSLAP